MTFRLVNFPLLMAIETQPSSAPVVYSNSYNVARAQQNHDLPQSSQILVSTPINQGVLYSTKLNPNKKLFITNGSMLLCCLCFCLVVFIIAVGTSTYTGGIVSAALLLCICLGCYFFDIHANNGKQAEIYSDHLKVCFFCFYYIDVNFFVSDLLQQRSQMFKLV